MRKSNEIWIEEQCQGIEESLQKDNNKKAYQLEKELTSSKQGRTTTNNDSYPILWEEVEAAVKSLKKCKSTGLDNIPSELVLAGGEAMIDICYSSSAIRSGIQKNGQHLGLSL